MADSNVFSFGRSRFIGAIPYVLLIVLVLGILTNPLFTALGRDSGIFLYIGSLILKGKLPYLSAWENKGPLVFYINALGLLISGGSRWGIWFLEFLFLLGAAYLGYRTARKIMGDVPALAGAFMWISALRGVLQGGNLTEEYSLLFYFLAFWAFVKSLEKSSARVYGFLIGISLGLNILLRPNNIGVQLAIVVAYFILAYSSRTWRLLWKRLIWITAGSLLVIFPVLVYFALRGGLSEMFEVVLLFNFYYGSASDLASIWKGIGIAFDAMRIEYYLLALVGYGMSVWLLWRRKIPQTSLGRLLLLLVIGWPIEVLLSTMSGNNYLHYFIVWMPYIGFLSSYTLYWLLNRLNDRYANLLSVGLTLLFFGVVFIGNPGVWRNYATVLTLRFSNPNPMMEYPYPIADFIAANTQPDDKVLVWGFRPAIYFMAGREAPASYLPYPLLHVREAFANRWGEQFFEQLKTNPPVMIVDVVDPKVDPIPSTRKEVRKTQSKILAQAVLAPNLYQVFKFIDNNYIYLGEVDGYPVYQWKAAPK